MFLGAGLALAGSYGLGCALTRRIDCSWAVRFCAGAAGLSLVVFLLMTAHLASRPALALVSVVGAAGVLLRPPRVAIPRVPWWAAAVLAVYCALYLASATAPEVEADPNTYHLSPARDALRHQGFSGEINFFERLPHAVELLYVIAFVFGGGPGAKLVHLAFLMASVPLIVRLAGSPVAGYAAALLYFLAPVVGISGTAAFNDAALVCAMLAMVVVLFEGQPAWLAGLLAGFCYAIKLTGGIAIPVGLLFLLWKRRWRDGVMFCAFAAIPVVPWLLRNLIDTGNPFAPFGNRLFPNPYFHVSTEQHLMRALRSYGVPFAERFTEVLWGWRLQGIIGPVFLLAPLALLGRRSFLVLAAAFSLPWWNNAGARFLMPALPFLALGMSTAPPRIVLYVMVGVQAVTAWPSVMERYAPKAWRMTAHLRRESWDWRVAKMIEANTSPSDRIYDLHGVHAAHVDRQFVGSWQSAPAEVLLRGLEFAKEPGKEHIYQLLATFSSQPVRAVRVRLNGSSEAQWSLPEIEFLNGDGRVPNSRRWSLDAEPNRWETPLLFDRNYSSRWMTWEPARPGQHVTIDFEGTERLTGVRVLGTIWDGVLPITVEIQREDGSWTPVNVATSQLAPMDLRHAAIAKMKRAGFTHIVARAGSDGTGQLGQALASQAIDWGLDVAGSVDTVYLLRIR